MRDGSSEFVLAFKKRQLTCRRDNSSSTTLPHDLINLASTTDIVIGQVLHVYAFRLFLVYLEIIILC